MPSCEYCGEATERLAYECDYCGESFCRSHRIPESHDCSGISNARPPTSAAHESDAFGDLSRGAQSAQDVDLAQLRERAKAEAEGQPYSVVDLQHTVSTTPEPDYDSTPDVAVDGSIKRKRSTKQTPTSESDDSISRSKNRLLIALFLLLVAAILYLVFLI
jgi:hypothetical protein